MHAYIKECKAAGLDPKEVERIANGISKYTREATRLGLQVFGGTGTGSLRVPNGNYLSDHLGDIVVAELDGNFSGGDGGYDNYGQDGLYRGEA